MSKLSKKQVTRKISLRLKFSTNSTAADVQPQDRSQHSPTECGGPVWHSRCLLETSDSNLVSLTEYSEVFVILLSPSKQILGWYLKLGHDYFLPNPFTIYLSSYNQTLYIRRSSSLCTQQVPGQGTKPPTSRSRMWYRAACSGLWHTSEGSDKCVWSNGWMVISRGKIKKLRGNPAPVPFCPSRISYEVTWDGEKPVPGRPPQLWHRRNWATHIPAFRGTQFVNPCTNETWAIWSGPSIHSNNYHFLPPLTWRCYSGRKCLDRESRESPILLTFTR
jgi:hypothetical protein